MTEKALTVELPKTLPKFVAYYLKDKKLYVAGHLFIGLVWAMEMAFSPYLLKILIETVATYTDDLVIMLQVIIWPAAFYISMSIFLNINFRLYDYINLKYNPEIKGKIMTDMFAYLMEHSYAFFQNNFSGSLSKKIWDMSVNVETIISIPHEWFFSRFVALMISVVMLFVVVHPVFGGILLLWTILFVSISYFAAKTSGKLSKKMSESASKLEGILVDSVANILSTKLFAKTASEIANLNGYISDIKNKDRDLQWQSIKVNFLQSCCVTLLMGSMLATLIYGRVHGWVTVGDFALVLTLSVSITMAVFNLGQQMLIFFKTVGICQQALSFIMEPHSVKDLASAKDIKIAQGEIIFQNVNFSYNKSITLFDSLELTIPAGQKVGLVGNSGGGKSSFIKLILRLMDIDSGRISIDGHDLKEFKKQSLREQIATIPQGPELFHRTIMENISFANQDANEQDVINAAKKARCHDFILELPEGYQSLVGERGVKLSGGQRQRIAIARAIIKEAPILLLDEATSALDSLTEKYIQEALIAAMQDKTVIVIAHRLSTLKSMDRILVFEKGRIIEDGTPHDLLQKPKGKFAQLWKMQSEGMLPLTGDVNE